MAKNDINYIYNRPKAKSDPSIYLHKRKKWTKLINTRLQKRPPILLWMTQL